VLKLLPSPLNSQLRFAAQVAYTSPFGSDGPLPPSPRDANLARPLAPTPALSTHFTPPATQVHRALPSDGPPPYSGGPQRSNRSTSHTQTERVMAPYSRNPGTPSLSAPPFSLAAGDIARADAERRAAAQRHRTAFQRRPSARSSSRVTPSLAPSNNLVHTGIPLVIDVTVLLHPSQVCHTSLADTFGNV